MKCSPLGDAPLVLADARITELRSRDWISARIAFVRLKIFLGAVAIVCGLVVCAQEPPSQDYIVYVVCESADKIEKIRFGPGGATAADVALMRRVVGAEMGVKAAGGVRDLEGVKAMIAAGATRVGASAGVKIVQQARGETPPVAAPSR